MQGWVKPLLLCPTPQFDWDTPIPPSAINVSGVTDLGEDGRRVMCGSFECNNKDTWFRCAAFRSEANSYCCEGFLVKIARHMAVILKAHAGTAPNIQENSGACLLWVDGVLSKDCGALANDASHYGGILISPVLLYICARGGALEEKFASSRKEGLDPNLPSWVS